MNISDMVLFITVNIKTHSSGEFDEYYVTIIGIDYLLNEYNDHMLDTSFINCCIYSFYGIFLSILLWL